MLLQPLQTLASVDKSLSLGLCETFLTDYFSIFSSVSSNSIFLLIGAFITPFNKKKLKCHIVFVYHVYLSVYYDSIHVGVRGQLPGAGSLIPPMRVPQLEVGSSGLAADAFIK